MLAKWTKNCDRLDPSAPLEIIDSEQRLEKTLKDMDSFDKNINNIKEMITYFKDKNNKSKKKNKFYKNSEHNIRIGRHICYY